MLGYLLERPEHPFCADDLQWAERSEYWRTQKPPRRGRLKKFHYREPIILCGHGIQLRVDHGTLLIRNGFTHYPQKSEEIRFFPGDPNLPDRIIISDGNGGISLDALNWMSEQKIEFVQLDWHGNTVAVGGNWGYSAKPELVALQRAATRGKWRISIARWLIREKIVASVATLEASLPNYENRLNAINRLKKCLADIDNSRKSISIHKILGIEGLAALTYFQEWHSLPLRWSGLSSRPIPPSWHHIGPRQMSWRRSYRNARHPVNAMLNYGYGILANKLRAEIISVGLDPTIGMIHIKVGNRIPLVYDLMEPLRPQVDRNILKLALGNTFSPGDFTINKWGGCRINPQMGKAIVGAIDVEAKGVVGDFVVWLYKGRLDNDGCYTGIAKR